MSVGRGGQDGIDRGNMETQVYRGTFRDNGIGANDSYTLQDVADLEPAGGIDRTEEAELAVLVIHHARTEWDQAVTTQAAGLRSGFELSRDEDPGPITQNRTQVDLSNNAFEGDAPTDALSRQVSTTDPDVLWFALMKAEVGANAEKGGKTFVDNAVIPFREWFGEGPVFRSSDELHLHGRVNVINREVNWVSDIMFTAYWDVRRTD